MNASSAMASDAIAAARPAFCEVEAQKDGVQWLEEVAGAPSHLGLSSSIQNRTYYCGFKKVCFLPKLAHHATIADKFNLVIEGDKAGYRQECGIFLVRAP